MPDKILNLTLNILIVLIVIVSLFILAVYLYCIRMPGVAFDGDLPGLNAEQRALSRRLSEHVRELAEEIGERHYQAMPALNRAAAYIQDQFKSLGYVPLIQRFDDGRFSNIVVELQGRQRRDEIIVIGAHYDTVWMTPGADDNASGVAALLEIARLLKERPLARSVRLVAFANEEEPFAGTEKMGSRVNARHASDNNEKIAGMISLEMLGYYSDEPGSQQYPPPLSYFYPRRANFIAFVSNISSRGFMVDAIKAFRAQALLPSVGLAAPQRLVLDIARSDHASFWAHGYPAFMLTDTSNFRNRHYHQVSDVHARLDYQRMTLLVSGLVEMIESLANK